MRGRMADLHQAASVDEVNGQEPQSRWDREAPATREPQERQAQGGAQRDPHGGHDRVRGGGPDGREPQVVVQRCEARRDLPPLWVERRHRGGGQRACLRPPHRGVTGCRVTLPPRRRVAGEAWPCGPRRTMVWSQVRPWAPWTATRAVTWNVALRGGRMTQDPVAGGRRQRTRDARSPRARATRLPWGRGKPRAMARSLRVPAGITTTPGRSPACSSRVGLVRAPVAVRSRAPGQRGTPREMVVRSLAPRGLWPRKPWPGATAGPRADRGAKRRWSRAAGECFALGGQRRPHIPQAVAPSQWGEDPGPAWAPPPAHAARAPGAIGWLP
jgi:hypothetical protein